MAAIRYFGSKADGYTATSGFHDARVRRESGGWKASYYGRPAVHNPWVNGVRSCMCPPVLLKETFRTRKAAAEAALSLLKSEEKALDLARKTGNEDAALAPVRALVAEKATVDRRYPYSL